jgi:hypothetical protein
MEETPQRLFRSHDMDYYRELKPPLKVFMLYVILTNPERDLHPMDSVELDKLEEVLDGMPLPDKVGIYRQLRGKEQRPMYRPFLLPKS